MDGTGKDDESRKVEEQEVATEEFKKRIIAGDGELIPLAKKGSNGEELFLTTRYISVPEGGESEQVDIIGSPYDEQATNYGFLGNINGILLFDIYAKKEGELTPIARNDWTINGENAKDSAVPRNMGLVLSSSEHEKIAQRTWRRDDIPIRVLPEFGKIGLGTLLLASSALVLNDRGAKYFQPTSLVTDSIQKTVTKFAKIKPSANGIHLEKGSIAGYIKRPAFGQVFKDFAAPLQKS